MLKYNYNDLCFKSDIGSNEILFYIEGSYMDTWKLDFKIESQEHLIKYTSDIMNGWGVK